MDTRKPSLQVILVTGVPGTGKSTISHLLALELEGDHIDLSKLAKEKGYIEGSDVERDTEIADLDAIRKYVEETIHTTNKSVIIDGHYSTDVVDPILVSIVVVLRRAPWVLRNELMVRGYKPAKVRENVESELLDTCLVDALETQSPEKICEFDTTGIEPDKTVKAILKALHGGANCGHGWIDWMSLPESEQLLRER